MAKRPGQYPRAAFKSRLIVGTGKYRSFRNGAGPCASGADMVPFRSAASIAPTNSKESLLGLYRPQQDFILPKQRETPAAATRGRKSYSNARTGVKGAVSNWSKASKSLVLPEREKTAFS